MEQVTHDTAPEVRTVKRRNVDVDDNEIPDSKRNKAVPDVDKKHAALLFVLHAHELLIASYGIGDKTHIDDVADLTSILVTAHNYNRQTANGVGGLRDLFTESFKFKANDKEFSGREVAKELKELAQAGFYSIISRRISPSTK